MLKRETSFEPVNKISDKNKIVIKHIDENWISHSLEKVKYGKKKLIGYKNFKVVTDKFKIYGYGLPLIKEKLTNYNQGFFHHRF